MESKSTAEMKLEKETTNLNLLKERLNKSSQLTSSIVGILDSFEHRLAKLEQTILPVYNDTAQLQRKQQNMERTLQSLDHVISYYCVAQEVSDVITAGPGDGLNNFLQAMNKLAEAQAYFNKNNPQSVELENVNTLYFTGITKLESELKDLLVKYSKPLLPIVLLDLIAMDEDSSVESAPPSLGMPLAALEDLRSICQWLNNAGRNAYTSLLGSVRGSVVYKSLTSLKEHQRTSSGGSMQKSHITYSPMPKSKIIHRTESTARKTSSRIHKALEKRANKMILKASQTLEQSTGLTLGPRRSASHAEGEDWSGGAEQDMEQYLELVMGLHRLMKAEQMLLVGLVPLAQQHTVFEIIVRDALDLVVQDGENIASRAKKCMSRHDFGSVLIVFPILKQLLALKPEFERTVEHCDINVKSKFSSILTTLHTTGVKALEDFIESVKSDNGTLPVDGTVHELTTNVLVFLDQILDYSDTIGGVLSQETVYVKNFALLPCYTQIAHDKEAKARALLAIYVRKVLGQLNLTLHSKSEQYSDQALRALFRLNNNHYLLMGLQRTQLLEVLTLSEPNCEQNYRDMIQEHKTNYLQSWNKLLMYITPGDEETKGSKLKDKDRASIKEKFAGFNKEMEECAKVQRSYSIPDLELRESLKRDNKETLLPKYNSFYDTYASLPFSKTPEKYVKHNSAQIANMLDRFFDVAA
ncbi:exocyst complex component 7 [Arctopsyche grandis]|uniref:exocyst complex component 7 n=1 Tax=Arctopsyche grandis TaxID=121162 RepID=UPI00406D6D0B